MGKYEIGKEKISFSETEIQLNSVNRNILSLCDGTHTVNNIIADVSRQMKIKEEDVKRSLEQIAEQLIGAKEMAIRV